MNCMNRKIVNFVSFFVIIVGSLILAGCGSVNEKCVTNGYMLQADCNPPSCVEQGYIREGDCPVTDCVAEGFIEPSNCVDVVDCVGEGYVPMEDVNTLINFTNDLINTTNVLTGEEIKPLNYFTIK